VKTSKLIAMIGLGWLGILLSTSPATAHAVFKSKVLGVRHWISMLQDAVIHTVEAASELWDITQAHHLGIWHLIAIVILVLVIRKMILPALR